MNTKTETTAIAEYSPTSAALADIATRMAKVVYDVSTPAGMAAAKADRAEVRDLRVALEKKRVEIKAPALTRCREIDTEAARITAELLKFETPPDNAIKAEECRIEAERQAKVDAEIARVAALNERIAELRGNQMLTPMSGSKLIAEHLSDLVALPVDESFGDLLDRAKVAKAEGTDRLTKLLETALANDKESARLLAERAELDRQRAEQDARDKIERDRVAAETAVANKKLADERAAFEAEQAERRRVAAIEENNRRAIAEREQAERNAENERIAAVQRAAQEVIDKANRELEARQQAERDTQANREREEREAVEAQERAEKEAREIAERKAVADAEYQRKLNFKPTVSEIIAVLCDHYQRDATVVDGWLRAAYSTKAKKVA